MFPEERMSDMVLPLMIWYRENARRLPWRDEPTPYRVWVSEIMLQQTRVAAVLDYFRRFMEDLPTISHLAGVEEERLMKLWQGLGYYSRARNLQKAAKVIETEHGGEFPTDYDQIRALPGIGDYTAGAISSIAFGQPRAAVDGNLLRVVSRVLGEEWDITRADTKKAITGLLAHVMPLEDPGAFNQAMMDLGATVCLPNGAPLCEKCPIAHLCLARQEGKTADIPVKAPKKARRVEKRQVFLILREGNAALRRRPEKGLLAGLWELPNELTDGTDWLKHWGVTSAEGELIPRRATGKHIFTHIEWHMTLTLLRTEGEELPEGWVWADGGELRETYPVPNAFAPFMPIVEENVRNF